MFSRNTRWASLAVVTLVLGVTACGGNQASNTTTSSPQTEGASPAANTTTGSNLSGTVKIDGSSTVFPISTLR